MMKKYFWLSVCAHLILLISVTWIVAKHFKSKKETSAILPTYVYHSSPIKQVQNKTGLQTPNKQMTASKSTRKHDSQEKIHQLLLNLLHEAIAAKQSYPEPAIEMKQTGTVTIGFLLTPDGKLNQIALLGSSGHQIIDSAALSAVQDVLVIPEAKNYLKKSESFSVEVVFR